MSSPNSFKEITDQDVDDLRFKELHMGRITRTIIDLVSLSDAVLCGLIFVVALCHRCKSPNESTSKVTRFAVWLSFLSIVSSVLWRGAYLT